MNYSYSYGEPFTLTMMPGDLLRIRHAMHDKLVCPDGTEVRTVAFGNTFWTEFVCLRLTTVRHFDIAPALSRSEFDEYRMGIVEFLRYREKLLKRYSPAPSSPGAPPASGDTTPNRDLPQ